MADPVVRETVPLTGSPWPTIDPFLFCVHHDDAYPAGNARFGPAASLRGRDLGADFAGIDGWRMYHGREVPGFPQHPHRGFETVTYVRRGLIDHSDSLGAAARFGRGDTQWLTAGRGIVHSEMFPLLDADAPNPLELFQIWLNLPRHRSSWIRTSPCSGPATLRSSWRPMPTAASPPSPSWPASSTATAPPAPPPDSWASRPDADVAIWHLASRTACDLVGARGRAPHDVARVLYVYAAVAVSATPSVEAPTGVVVQPDVVAPVQAGPDGAEVLMLQGRPIGEPVAQYGPFVMNEQHELAQAFADYQSTGFGGWPWSRDDPVHGADRERFARHADGHEERVDEPVS